MEDTISTQNDETVNKEQDTVQNMTQTRVNSSQSTDKPKKTPTETTPPQPVVLKKEVKPIEVAPTPQPKEVTETVAKDPEGMFDYSGCETYEVKQGDTLLKIAQKFVVALRQLRYFNHIDKSMKIKPGKTLYIPKEPIDVPYGE